MHSISGGSILGWEQGEFTEIRQPARAKSSTVESCRLPLGMPSFRLLTFFFLRHTLPRERRRARRSPRPRRLFRGGGKNSCHSLRGRALSRKVPRQPAARPGRNPPAIRGAAISVRCFHPWSTI